MIFYFSGTGNSAYAAKRIAKGTGDSLYSIGEAIRDQKLFRGDAQGPVVFVVPAYSWRIPNLAEEWIRRSEFGEDKQAYFVMTCGAEIGNAEKYVKKLCADKGFLFMGCGEIVMPENYIALFTTPGEEEAREIIERAEPEIDRLIQKISRGEAFAPVKKTLAGAICSSLVHALFYPLIVHAGKFWVRDSCTGCGKCVRECMLHNISLKDKKPVWGKSCTHCMACISGCPAEAIEYGKHSAGLPRYRCPGGKE